ncbi:MAG: metal-dependent transcriptional regulator [Anaerolineae bacterium]
MTILAVSENAQELLERLWIAEQEEHVLLQARDVDPGTAEELVGQGLLSRAGANLQLTEAGRPEAALAIRRHRLAERLLADLLQTQDALLDEQACRLEHVLQQGLDESICTLLGHPRQCPHGKPIPQGACCRQMRNTVQRLIALLNELDPGQSGQVAYLRTDDPGRLQKLMAMGVLPGGKIALLRRSPAFVFECGYSQFAVDAEIAKDIYVRLAQTGSGA